MISARTRLGFISARRRAAASIILGLSLQVPAAAQEVRIERDLIYCPRCGPDQALDLHLPAANGFPTILFLHGGSLREGTTRSSPEYAGVCQPFVAAGVACANVDYRLAPTHRWPAMPEDVAAAVRWVRDNIGERGGDRQRLFLFGHSSGCHLAAAVATNPKYLQSVDLTPGDLAGFISMGCTLAPFDPILRQAQAQGLGIDDLRVRWNRRPDDVYVRFDDYLESDPSRSIGSHVPPALIVIAHRERFQPPILEQAARFVDLMYEAGRPADIAIVPGSHRSSIADLGRAGNPSFGAILGFIQDPGAAGLDSRPSSIP